MIYLMVRSTGTPSHHRTEDEKLKETYSPVDIDIILDMPAELGMYETMSIKRKHRLRSSRFTNVLHNTYVRAL